MDHAREITEAAIVSLENGVDPLARTFLVENDVGLDACLDLAERLALAGRIYLRLIDDMNGTDRTRAEAAIALVGRVAAGGYVAGGSTDAVARQGSRVLVRVLGDRVGLASSLATE
jgi:hypothetical protein